MPFSKNLWATNMYDSQSQRDLLHGLLLWNEVKGIALVTGPSGVGKSITLRRYASELEETRFHTVDFNYLPTTVNGLLRSLSRKLGLPMRLHSTDLFDAALTHLTSYEQEHAQHPIVIIDNGEGLTVEALDLMRRLTCSDMDAEDRFSILIIGTEDLLAALRDPILSSLRSRIGYVHALRAFTLEDTRNYIHFHLERAEVDPKIITEDATKRIFHASQGKPRSINQLATQALIQAVILGRENIDGDFMNHLIAAHPLYQVPAGADR